MNLKKGTFAIFTGLLLLLAALFLTVYNLYDGWRAWQSAVRAADQLETLIPARTEEAAVGAVELEIPDYLLNPEMEMPIQHVDGQDYIGILKIPAFDLSLPVISEWSYPRLKTAPCRYSGSAYTDDLIIAAHNYALHFGRLKGLSEGDTVIFTDVDGNVFQYRVLCREILMPMDTEEMESGEWDLTLFTCTRGGQSRVTVRCERVSEE